MPKQTEKERVKQWQNRTVSANKAYTAWSDEYKTDECEKYWEGKQWADQPEAMADQKYVINMIAPTIEIKIPSLLFYTPQVKITPRPNKSDDLYSTAADRARLQQDTVNTIIADPRLNFVEESTLAIRESFFRYGVVEVGYSGDFIDNPLLSKPELNEQEKELVKAPKVPNPKNPNPETVFIKRIPTKQFRVGVNSKNSLDRCDWCGYYEDHYVADVKNNPNYSNTGKLKATGKIKTAFDVKPDDTDERDASGNVIGKDTLRVWKIWDLRGRKKIIFGEGCDKFFFEESFSYLPFATYKPYPQLDDFYPKPPVFDWLHPQNEKNEIREMRKIHRRRFKRRYLNEQNVEKSELEKLEDSDDGTCIAVPNTTSSIVPLQDAQLDRNIVLDEQQSQQDFREITATGSEQRGETDPNTTATQANIVAMNTRVRDNYQRQQVSKFLARICWLILKTVEDKMALSFWIAMNTDMQGQAAQQEAQKVVTEWKQITGEELGDIEYDISVDVQSMTPVADEGEKQNWLQALQVIITNPSIATSDVLLRKTLSYYNIRSETEIQEIKKAAQAMMLMQAQQAAQKNGVGGQQGAPAPGPTPGNTDIQSQLMEQMGGMQ